MIFFHAISYVPLFIQERLSAVYGQWARKPPFSTSCRINDVSMHIWVFGKVMENGFLKIKMFGSRRQWITFWLVWCYHLDKRIIYHVIQYHDLWWSSLSTQIDKICNEFVQLDIIMPMFRSSLTTEQGYLLCGLYYPKYKNNWLISGKFGDITTILIEM